MDFNLEKISYLEIELDQKSQELAALRSSHIAKDCELAHLKLELERCEFTIAALNTQLREKSPIREVPVYIEKDIIVEVPVPIYINQKEEKPLSLPLPNCNEENSIACNEESIEIYEKSIENDSARRSNARLGQLCRSIKGSEPEEEDRQKSRAVPEVETRIKRIKEIVEVPVYITKEILREVPVIQEVVVEREVIRYVEVERSKLDEDQQISAIETNRKHTGTHNLEEEENPISEISIHKKNEAGFDDDFCIESPRNNIELLL